MITEFKLFENNSQNLEDILSNAKDNPRKVLDYIGLDDYKVNTTLYDRDFPENEMFNEDELHILIKSSKLEEIMGIEEGSIEYIQHLSSSYSGYEYYVDDNELDYINSYLDEKSTENIKKLADIFDYNIDIEEEGDIKNFFEYLGLKGLLDDIKREISIEHERAIEKASSQALKNLPFFIDNTNDRKFDLEIIFYYEDVIKYIKENNLKVKNFKELLENCDTTDIGYDIDYGETKYKLLGDFEGVRSVINEIEDYIDDPDEIFPKLIAINNLELIKEKKELADFFYWYDGWIKWDRVRFDLFQYAKAYNNDVLKWFRSYEFQKWFLENYNKESASNIQNYILLKTREIIDPKIEKEYEYLVDVEKYNL